MTIDGEDARDFDDAVYCEKKRGGGWRLWVAIAAPPRVVAPVTAPAHKRPQVRPAFLRFFYFQVKAGHVAIGVFTGLS